MKRTIKIEKLFLKRFMLKLNHGDIKKWKLKKLTQVFERSTIKLDIIIYWCCFIIKIGNIAAKLFLRYIDWNKSIYIKVL